MLLLLAYFLRLDSILRSSLNVCFSESLHKENTETLAFKRSYDNIFNMLCIMPSGLLTS